MNAAFQAKVLVIGTRHEFQRLQRDNDAARDEIRHQFQALLPKLVASRHVELIAEEAGDDQAVADSLTLQGYPQGPQVPIAKRLSEGVEFCEHIDVRPAGGENMAKEQYEQAMLDLTLAEIGSRTSILVIVGEDHRQAMSTLFAERSFQVESRSFP